MDLKDIHKIHLQEKRSGVLVKVEKGFYQDCFDLIQSKRAMLDSNYSEIARNDFENARNILQDLILRRNHKVVLKVFNDLKSNANDVDGLSREEFEFYSSLLDLMNKYQVVMNSLLDGKRISPPSKIKILQDIPTFIGSNSKTIGPFETGQEVELASEDAKSLIEKALAVRL